MLKIILTENQWKRISELLANVGLLVMGSIIVPFLSNFNDPFTGLWGIVITGVLWYFSIRVAKKY